MPLIIGIHFSASIIKKGGCTLGHECALEHTEQTGGEPERPNNSRVVAKTLDITQAGKEDTSLTSRAKCDLLHGASGVPEKSFLRQVGQELFEMSFYFASRNVLYMNVTTKAPHSELYDKVHGRHPNALSYEQLESFADVVEANMEFASKKVWDLHKNIHFRPPN